MRLVALALTLGITGCGGQQAQAPAPAPTNQYIGDAEAKRIALENAGLSEANVFDLDCELDLDDGTVHYDVDFKANGYEYDYDIDATTGAIIYSHADIDD